MSPKRTTAEAELGNTDALGVGGAEAIVGGAAGTVLATGSALGTGGGSGVGAGVGTGAGAAGAAAGAGSGSGAEAGAEAEALGTAEAGAGAPAAAEGRPETRRGGASEGEALAVADCACTRPAPSDSPMAKQSPMRRNRSPQTRVDVDKLTEDLTLGRTASVTGLATASTIRPRPCGAHSPEKRPQLPTSSAPLEAVAKILRRG